MRRSSPNWSSGAAHYPAGLPWSATAMWSWRAPTSGGRSVSCWPVTWTPCRSPATCPSRREGDILYGCGTARHEVRSGRDAAGRPPCRRRARVDPRVDLTWVCYDCEEVEAARNGLGRLAGERPQALRGDLAVLLEPTLGVVEGGCQGTLRFTVRDGRGARAQRAVVARRQCDPRGGAGAGRSLGYPPRTVEVDGLELPRGLNAVGDQRRRRGQRHPRRVRRHGELPLRPRP